MIDPIVRNHAPLRRVLLCGLAVGAVLAATAARAEPPRPIHIAAGPLHAALMALAAQTHQQLLFRPDLVAGRQVAALDGQYTTEAVLDRLLRASGIAATRAGPGVFILRAANTSAAPDLAPLPGEPNGAAGAPPFAVEPAADGVAAPLSTLSETAAPPSTVSEVQVIGSHVRGARAASPVVVLDREAIDRSGRATVAEVLETLPQNFAGQATEGTVTTGADTLSRNTAFASSVNLRGLGPDATLVLVNGRRMAGSGSFGDFSDVSGIPTAAVSRIEVLLDGASALYGADAVGGVVNIILRKDLEGAETRLLAGVGTAGEPFQGQFAQTFGHAWSGGNVLIAYEYQQRDALPSASRPFAATADLRPLGGTDRRLQNAFPGNILRTDPVTGGLVPGWAIPAGQTGVGLKPADLQAGVVNRTNQHQGNDLFPRQAVHALYLSANQALTDRLEVSADARYSHRIYAVRSGPPIGNIAVNTNNPFFVSPTGATSHSIAYSYIGDIPNPRQRGIADNLGASLGGKLKLGGDWQVDGYLAFAQAIETAHSTGTINTSHLTEAVGSVADRPTTPFSTAVDGFFNPFSGIPGSNRPAVLAYISNGFSAQRAKDQVSSANLQADGTLVTLPGGPVKLALGGQAREEHLVREGTNFFGLLPTPQVRTDVKRQVLSAFGEIRAPLFGPDNRRPGLERLEISLSGRVERYDDVGSTANPQVGLIWQPHPDLTVRGTYGTSFRAPALRAVHDPAGNSAAQFPLGPVLIRGLLLDGGNPDLKPETAETWTAGLDFAPASRPGLRLSFTVFDARFHDRIDRPVFSNAINALTDPSLASFVTRISPGTNAADRALIAELLSRPESSSVFGVFPPEAFGAIIDDRYVNTTALHVRGLDLTGAYRFELGTDQVALAGNASYMLKYDQQITPTSPVVDKAGVANFPVRFRGRLTADWTRDRLTAGAAVNYIGAYHDALGVRIGDQPTLDLQLRLAPADRGFWRGASITLNVRNVFDRDPPFYDNPTGFGYDPANADPIGRFVSVQLMRTW